MLVVLVSQLGLTPFRWQDVETEDSNTITVGQRVIMATVFDVQDRNYGVVRLAVARPRIADMDTPVFIQFPYGRWKLWTNPPQ